MPTPAVRVVVATVNDDRMAGFNQVVMERDSPPQGVLLVAVDLQAGLHLWLAPFATVQPLSRVQISGYSRSLQINVDTPPTQLGLPVVISPSQVDAIRPGLWSEICDAQTGAKNRLVSETFGF